MKAVRYNMFSWFGVLGLAWGDGLGSAGRRGGAHEVKNLKGDIENKISVSRGVIRTRDFVAEPCLSTFFSSHDLLMQWNIYFVTE